MNFIKNYFSNTINYHKFIFNNKTQDFKRANLTHFTSIQIISAYTFVMSCYKLKNVYVNCMRCLLYT